MLNIRIYFSKPFLKIYLPYLVICFLIGSVVSLVLHRDDYRYYQAAHKKMKDLNVILAKTEDSNKKLIRWQKRYLTRSRALLDDGKREKWELRRAAKWEKMRQKYL